MTDRKLATVRQIDAISNKLLLKGVTDKDLDRVARYQRFYVELQLVLQN